MKTLTKCHETMGEGAKDHVRRLCHSKTDIDEKLNTSKHTLNTPSEMVLEQIKLWRKQVSFDL